MTTPERIRNRQRRETALVVGTILLACGSVFYNDHVNDRQDDCFRDVLSVRGELTQRAQRNTDQLLLSVPTLTDREDFEKAFARYEKEQAAIQKARERVPIRGSC